MVATVSQQMDENDQLVVRIESIDVDQKVLDAIEPHPSIEDPIVMSPFKDEILTSSTSELAHEFGTFCAS